MNAIALAETSVRDLLKQRAIIDAELRRRKILRSSNNPIADIAEELVAQHYNGRRAIATQAGWDVKTPAGEKLQVKAMRNAGYQRTSLSAIRSQDYDAVVVVIFNEDFNLLSALYIPRAVIEANVAHNSHVNGRIVRLSKRFMSLPGIRQLELSDIILDARSGA